MARVPSKADYNYAREILNRLCELGFNKAIDSSYDDDMYHWNRVHGDELDEMGVRFACGCSKEVIIVEDFDWVIKVDFIPKYHFSRYKFSVREAQIFAAACKRGFDHYFAATYELEDSPLEAVLQEYVYMDEYHFTSLMEDYVASYLDIDRNDYEDDDLVMILYHQLFLAFRSLSSNASDIGAPAGTIGNTLSSFSIIQLSICVSITQIKSQ